MNRRHFSVLLLTAVFLVACAPPAARSPVETMPTDTPALVLTATPEPTSTPEPTDTTTPTPQPTSTPTPTPVPTPTPFPGSAFSVEVVGYGEHGAMFELHYDGNWSDLDQVTIDLTAEQNGQRIDVNQALEAIDGRRLAEMTDALYHLGPIDIRLRIAASDAARASIETETELTQRYPFVGPIMAHSDFATNRLIIVPRHGYEQGKTNEWYATDLLCGPEGNYDCDGTPVYMPCSIQVLYVSEEKFDTGQNMVFLHPYSGHILALSHQVPSDQLLEQLGNPVLPYFADPDTAPVIPYDPTTPVSSWAKPKTDMKPHLHIEGQVFVPGDPDLWAGISVADGPKRYGNCLPQDFGPCLPDVYNISLERYLLEDWLNPDL